MNGHLVPPQAGPSTSKTVKTRYREAARSFINSDFLSSLHAVDAALATLPVPDELPLWVEALAIDRSTPIATSADLQRKVIILLITLVATCYANQKSLPAETAKDPLLAPYLLLKPDAAVTRLFHVALARYEGDPAHQQTDDLPSPSPSVSRLPPSIVVALALGALKMEAPRAAKACVVAWLGSTDERTEALLEAEGDAYDTSPESSLTSSALSLSITSTPADAGASPAKEALMSYERLLELYALHILPALGQWDEAEEWVKLLARDNGGWARRGKVEWLTTALRETKQSHAEDAERQRQHAMAQAAREKDLKKQQSAKKAKKRAANGTSSDEHSSASGRSPPKIVPPTLVQSPPPPDPEPTLRRRDTPLTGFAAMRAALAEYLRPGAPSISARPHETFFDRLLRVFAEQSRMLSFLTFVVALVAWRRRAKKTLGEQTRTVWLKLKETVSMGTRATFL